ncbi:MAG: hypothetical protein QOC77_3848, partial [Thermoleophilaceae bacterium]|nr:hypothetical protein [Thermoleophilaceae bacterium]
MQQAFISSHRAIHSGEEDLNLRPWLYRIAHNAALNLLRQHGFDHDEVSEEIDGVETPPQAFERGERLRTVVAAVQELPERQRSAIVLQALEGRSYDEIAVELGVTGGAVRQLLNRARNTLREAAAALTPAGMLTRIASSGGEASVTERVAEAVAGAGGGALLAKAGAALVVAGAVAGGAATGALPGTGGTGGKPNVAAAAAAPVAGGSGPKAKVVLADRSTSGSQPATGGGGRGGVPNGVSTRSHGHGGGAGPGSSGDGSRHGGSGHGGDSGSGSGSGGGSGSGDGHSGSGDGGGSGGGSGSGSGDSSGSGSGGDSSGSGDGGGSSGTSDSSGSGSSDSGSGSSGS